MKYQVLAFLCLISIIAYVQRVSINSAHEPIQSDLGIDTEEFGLLGSAFLVGYAIMQVPSGWLADRWGSRRALALYAVLWSVLAGSIGVAQSFWCLAGLWLAIGMAQAGVFPCAAKAIGAWFPDTQRAMASGLIGSSTMLGTAIASSLTVLLLGKAGLSWQWIYVSYGLAGVVWTGLFLAKIPERGRGAFAPPPPMTGGDWRRIFTSVPMWLLCGQQFFRAGAMIFFINWFPKFLRESRGLAAEDAGLITTSANGCAMLGGICGGFFSDWLLRRTGQRRLSRQGIAVVGLAIAAYVVFQTHFVTDINVATILFSVGAFTATFGGVSGYTVTIEYGGTRIGTVFSIMNMSGNIGAAIFTYLAGAVVQRTGSWDLALYMFAGIFMVDAACWAMLNPKGSLFEATG